MTRTPESSTFWSYGLLLIASRIPPGRVGLLRGPLEGSRGGFGGAIGGLLTLGRGPGESGGGSWDLLGGSRGALDGPSVGSWADLGGSKALEGLRAKRWQRLLAKVSPQTGSGKGRKWHTYATFVLFRESMIRKAKTRYDGSFHHLTPVFWVPNPPREGDKRGR